MQINDADDLRSEVARVIKEGFYRQLVEIEQSKGLESGSLNSTRTRPGDTGLLPRTVFTHDLDEMEVNLYPAVLIMSETVSRVEQRAPQYATHIPGDPWEIGPEGDVFERTYQLVIHSWIMGQSESALSRDRDWFERALWRTLYAGKFSIENARIRTETYQSSWQDLDVQSEGLITGVSARFAVSVQELISTPSTQVATNIGTKVSHFAESE